MRLWGDRVPRAEAARHSARFAYLGRGFEFIERSAGAAPGLGNIHCFNWGVTVSHGAVAGDIAGVPKASTGSRPPSGSPFAAAAGARADALFVQC